MKKKKIICFGDSNTYGYDPRTCGRYDESYRWVDILCANGYDAVNEGQNARELPSRKSDYDFLTSIIREHFDADIFLIALGTNDVYYMFKSSAKAIADKLRKMFTEVVELSRFKEAGKRIYIIAPPIDTVYEYYEEKSIDDIISVFKALPTEYKSVAEELGVGFIDASMWDIPQSFDGCHLSEEGHIKYAKCLMEFLENEK